MSSESDLPLLLTKEGGEGRGEEALSSQQERSHRTTISRRQPLSLALSPRFAAGRGKQEQRQDAPGRKRTSKVSVIGMAKFVCREVYAQLGECGCAHKKIS